MRVSIEQLNSANTKEVREHLMDVLQVESIFQDNKDVSYIHHEKKPVLLGSQFLLKVNTSVGISDPTFLSQELEKIEAISSCCYAPDLIMDHTFVKMNKPLWKYLIEMTDVPIGTVPAYTVFQDKVGIDSVAFLERIEEMAEGGVRFMTFHPTATADLRQVADEREIPVSSWGGSDILRDLELNKRQVNVVVDNYYKILAILKKYSVTLSVGSVFRPARIDEALDTVHIRETENQKIYIDIAKEQGVNVIMEGIGHLPLSLIPKYCDLIRPHETPLMPLGPMPTDAAIGFDHVAAAVGGAFVAKYGNVGILNSVTREEHLGGVPSTSAVVEGLMCAKVVSHMINLERFVQYRNIDKMISDNRAKRMSCIVDGGLFGISPNSDSNEDCTRCHTQCPLKKL